MITVFTPTYNRAYIIEKLYESLCWQTCKDFEWLVVDDGSRDNTKELINSFMAEGRVNIRYIYQENGGKQRAINRGVHSAKGDLFFIVDSDDFITSDAIEKISSSWNEIRNNGKYAGLCYRKIRMSTLEVIGDSFPCSVLDSDSLTLAYHYNLNIDKAEVFITNILKRFPFPEIEGEKFVPEALVWYRIASAGFKLRCIDEGVYCCEYLPDGLTQNFHQNLKRNNRGFYLFYRELLFYHEVPLFPYKIKALVRLIQCYFYNLLK